MHVSRFYAAHVLIMHARREFRSKFADSRPRYRATSFPIMYLFLSRVYDVSKLQIRLLMWIRISGRARLGCVVTKCEL